jgi:uncharacterized protein (TIGR02271 family)
VLWELLYAMVDEKTSRPIPLAQEELHVRKRTVATGKVRVRTVVDTSERLVRETLKSERVEVTRIPVGKDIDAAPEVRVDGDTTIIPIVEEVLVVEKRLVLTEELHVRKIVDFENVEEPVSVRKQRGVVERVDFEKKN